jgi:hypothetical protein
MELLEHLGFNYSGSKKVRGRELLEFYLNLYERPHPHRDEDNRHWHLI